MTAYEATTENRVYYSRTVAPTQEPITIDEANRQLQISVGDDIAFVSDLIRVARDVTENATGYAIMTQTRLAAMRTWPSCGLISISVAPVNAVTSIKYYAYGETALTTLSASNYVASTVVSPAVIIFDEDFDPPALADRPDAVQITFTAGNSNPANVPPSIKHAVRILVRHFYDHPEMVATGSVNELPMNINALLMQNRVSGWVA